MQVFVWGGWDGDESQSVLWSLPLPDNTHTQRASNEARPGDTPVGARIETRHSKLSDQSRGLATNTPRRGASAGGEAAERARPQLSNSWNVSSPLELGTLRAEPEMAGKLADIEDLGKGPCAVIRLLHTTAVQRGYGQYIDPATGFSVFTSLFLVVLCCKDT